MLEKQINSILITGASGFIGMHAAEKFLASGCDVVGIDNLNDYYDVNLKKDRLNRIIDHENFSFHERLRSIIHQIHIVQSTGGIMKMLSYYPAFKKDKMFSQITRKINDCWETIMNSIAHQEEGDFLNEVLANLRISHLDSKNVN